MNSVQLLSAQIDFHGQTFIVVSAKGNKLKAYRSVREYCAGTMKFAAVTTQ